MKNIVEGSARRVRGMRRAKVAFPLGLAALVGLPVLIAGGAGQAGALTPNLPQAPDNLMIFPNRDFITVEGFADHVGQSGKVEVTRPGVGVVGSAIGVVSGGDVAFEVNHPGGICWGEGTGLKVTPDIKAGDVVTLTFGSTQAAATTTLDVAANDAEQFGATVKVSGRIGDGVDPLNMEQRIIEPALVDTLIGKRDVRAVPGGLVTAPKGGYDSSLEWDLAADTFLATYNFVNESDATIAANAGLGERAMAWELTDPAGNRQGMTIAENGEPGGPGMGGCPNGPLQSGPPGPTSVAAVKMGNDVKVNWTPAVAIPGTAAITGYRVTAVAHDPINGEQVEIGKRITNPAATSTTLTGAGVGLYDIKVVSMSSVGETFPAVAATVAPPDLTPPTVTASPNGGSFQVAQQVTLTSPDVGADIYYTLDGRDPIIGDALSSPEPLRYTGPITIDSTMTLKFAAFDPSNNHSTIGESKFYITNDPVAAQTAFTTSTVGVGQVTLNWTAAAAGAPGATIAGYEINVLESAGATVALKTVTTTGVGTSAVITGLPSETPLFFTVSARNTVNAAYGPPSAVLGPLTPQGDVFADAGLDKTGLTRGTSVTLSAAGSSTATGTTYSWVQLVTGAAVRTPVAAGQPDFVILTPVANQPQNATFTLPFYQNGMTTGPLTFEVTVKIGSVYKTDTVQVSARSDTLTMTTAKWKTGDFRVTGTSTTDGAIITLRSPTGTIYGTGSVVAGVFDIRIRGNTVPTTRPPTAVVDSNLGGSFGPFAVAQG